MTKVTHVAPAQAGRARGRVDHIVILDGTLASLRKGEMSNAGLSYLLFAEGGPRAGRTLFYEEGIQWQGWRRGMDVVEGRGIEGQIARAYGHLASHYRTGDRIWLFGYSRGAYAVRSLAGLIDRIGLLRQDAAVERNVRLAMRHYQLAPHAPPAQDFARAHCHAQAPIEMIGVWDTVKALGLRFPLLWKLTERHYAFHSTQLGDSVRHGFHALALNEDRAVFTPVLWSTRPQPRAKPGSLTDPKPGHHPGQNAGHNTAHNTGHSAGWQGNVEQVWFRGGHGDIGGQLGDFETARPLSNIPLVWMLDRAEACGLPLPEGWRRRFRCDPSVAMVGSWRGWGIWFLYRKRRQIGIDPSERLHESVPPAERARWPKSAPH